MITVKSLSHSFSVGKKGDVQTIPVLKDVSFSVKKGEIISIVGRSGSGKSTLLNLLSGYIYPTSGEITILDQVVSTLNEKGWSKFRLEHFGFIFQSFQLIPSLTTYENIELPLVLKGVQATERDNKVLELLEQVGLEKHANHYPNELSGGQQQRVSIARALITNPKIIFADEPTGSLDSETEKDILSFIQKLNEEMGITFLIITHDDEVSAISHRKFDLKDGVLIEGGISVAAK